MTPSHLIHECRRRGAILRRDGYALEIQRPSLLTPALIEQVKVHKPAVLAILDAEAGVRSPDESPLIHLAQQVVSGEFVGASAVLTESITITLRASRHPQCVRALIVLAGQTVRP